MSPETQTWGKDLVELFFLTVPFPENVPSHSKCGGCLPGPRGGKAAYWEPQFLATTPSPQDLCSLRLHRNQWETKAAAPSACTPTTSAWVGGQ